MTIINRSLVILISLILVGCSSSVDNYFILTPTIGPQAIIGTEPPLILHPTLSGWDIGDDAEIKGESFLFAIQIIEIREDLTNLVYSISGTGFDQVLNRANLQLVDQNGLPYKLLQVTPLAEFDSFQVGALSFEPRDPQATELHLILEPPGPDIQPHKLTAAYVAGADLDTSYQRGEWMTQRTGYFDQDAYRISFNGWGLIKGDTIGESASWPGMTMEESEQLPFANTSTLPETTGTPLPYTGGKPYPPPVTPYPETPLPTASPTPLNPIAGELASGEMVSTDATLRIEDTATGKVSYLYLLFLLDGKVKGKVLD